MPYPSPKAQFSRIVAIIHPRWRLLLLAILKNFIESSFNCQQIHRSHHLLWQFEMKTLSNLVWIDARLNKKHESFTIRSEKTSYWDVVSCKKALCVYISLWRANLKKYLLQHHIPLLWEWNGEVFLKMS